MLLLTLPSTPLSSHGSSPHCHSRELTPLCPSLHPLPLLALLTKSILPHSLRRACTFLVLTTITLLPLSPSQATVFLHPILSAIQCMCVRSKCTALLNWKHGRFGRIRALASAHVLRLTTYYHVPKYFG